MPRRWLDFLYAYPWLTFVLMVTFFLCFGVTSVNLFILQVRAAFVSMLAILLCVWVYKCGVRRLPLLIGAGVLGWILLFDVAPDAGLTMGDQLLAAVTVDTEGDTSIQQRAEAIADDDAGRATGQTPTGNPPSTTPVTPLPDPIPADPPAPPYRDAGAPDATRWEDASIPDAEVPDAGQCGSDGGVPPVKLPLRR